MKIVAVDDDPHILRLMTGYLESKGATVVTSTTPFIATLVKNENPDVLVVDADMPLLQGEWLVKALNHHDLCAGIPVLFFSALPEPVLARAVESTRAAGYVRKQDGVEALHRRILEVARKR
jgi:CheY-like chemotaxis protein